MYKGQGLGAQQRIFISQGLALADFADTLPKVCGHGGTGRRTGLKILSPQGRAGSIPAARTIGPIFAWSDLSI